MSPNWCNNTLEITGPKDQIAVFKEIIAEYDRLCDKSEWGDNKDQKMDFTLSAFYPRNPVNPNDWYEWSCANWGTKWDVSSDALVSESETELRYDFDSAWSPPIPAIHHISIQFPDLCFDLEYSETGMNFEGTFIVKDGNITKSEQRVMQPEPEE